MSAIGNVPFCQIDGLGLTPQEVDQLIASYANAGLLGAREAIGNRDRFSVLISTDSIAVACCRILNDFKPLDRIVDSLIEESDELHRERYLVAALAQHCFRGGVRFDVLAITTGRGRWDEQFSKESALPLCYLERSNGSFIVPISASLATRVLERSDKNQLLAAFVKLANGISARINRRTIRSRSAEARIANRLFDYDQVVHPFLGDLADQFYADTKLQWQWNSRYWEQLALRALARYFSDRLTGGEYLTAAIQHARFAVSIEFHPLPLTTLGKVLIAQMKAEPGLRNAAYREAFTCLTQAIAAERERPSRTSIQPFATLFRGTRDYFVAGGTLRQQQRVELQRCITEASTWFPRESTLESAIAEIRAFF